MGGHMKGVILASASPRRRELLSQIGLEFAVMASSAEEVITKREPAQVVEELSRQKAEDVASQVDEGIVIGADTVVCHDGMIMGKPKDREEAAEMIRRIQGDVHSVFTGVTVLRKDEKTMQADTFSCETKVRVYPMTEQEIQAYVDTGEPMDKAGAYGIQGRFAAWVEAIEGDYNNVVGLPVSALWQILKQYC